MRDIALLCILGFTFFSCDNATRFGEKEKAAVTGEVRTTLNAYNKAVKEKGLLGEFDFLDSSADFFWVPPGYDAPISFDTVAAVLRKNAGMYSSVENSATGLRIYPLSNELATYSTRVHSKITDTAGKQMNVVLVETGLMIKRKNGWKLFQGHTSIAKTN